jgi:hypothetical protein
VDHRTSAIALALIHYMKGALMAHRRSTTSNDAPVLVCLQGTRPDSDRMPLARAEAHALRASASRTHQQLTKHPLSAIAVRPS